MGQGRLGGKVAIVVGAGQEPGQTPGNGRAVSERYAQEGATLLLVDVDAARAQATLDAVRQYGGEATTLVADVTNEDDCRAIAATCLARYGRIDVLHNNVGVAAGDAPTTELDADAWDRLMALNVKGLFMTCKHVLPSMIERRSGCIVNISSVASLMAMPVVAYKTAKGAVNTFTQHLAMEQAANGIRVNCILPGLIDAPIAIERRVRERGVSHEVVRRERDAKVPMGYMGSALDIANAAVFLASDEARYITGVLLPVDGGILCKVG
jgi:NAD(P)-dependent dehydrogenase (short-subunit alcohol dehydrogenase family)